MRTACPGLKLAVVSAVVCLAVASLPCRSEAGDPFDMRTFNGWKAKKLPLKWRGEMKFCGQKYLVSEGGNMVFDLETQKS